MPLATGTTFAGYTILRLLGSGGMAEVYLAQHPRLPRRDALKVVSEAITADTDFRERFHRQADLASTLWQPHIVGVHDCGEFDGRLWIAMDYVAGTDAGQLVKNRYPAGMSTEDACAIVTAVADALDYAHKRGLLHRDVKPANILLTEPEDGKRRILLADFGIARPPADISGLTATEVWPPFRAPPHPSSARMRASSGQVCADGNRPSASVSAARPGSPISSKSSAAARNS
jgi:serine/threonine protein kinase, bacterial